ncbi:MAG: imidazole glycerol phosphate synthase subunit HisH [Rhodothermaceae bacterium]
MIAIIDYKAGNVTSITNVLDDFGVEYKITKKEIDITKADKIILPGVGEASFVMRKMALYNLVNLLRIMKKPTLGICLGMQILCGSTEERDTKGLGIFPEHCKMFDKEKVKVPQMGWNSVNLDTKSDLFKGLDETGEFYFANSFYVPESQYTIANAEYDVKFSAAIQKENFYGIQFHPEKSGEPGIQILKNFIEL